MNIRIELIGLIQEELLKAADLCMYLALTAIYIYVRDRQRELWVSLSLPSCVFLNRVARGD